jgi:hypothetical protein
MQDKLLNDKIYKIASIKMKNLEERTIPYKLRGTSELRMFSGTKFFSENVVKLSKKAMEQ